MIDSFISIMITVIIFCVICLAVYGGTVFTVKHILDDHFWRGLVGGVVTIILFSASVAFLVTSCSTTLGCHF